MKAKITEAFAELVLIALTGIKVLLVYILPSTIVAFLLSSEFKDFLVNYPIVNTFFVLMGESIKKKLGDNSLISKVL